MARYLAWFPPALLLAADVLFDPYWGQLGGIVALPWLVPLILYGLISFSMDLAFRVCTTSLPGYKRHFAILGLLLLFISIKDGFFLHPPDLVNTWLMCIAGIFLGHFVGSLPFLFGSRDQSYGWRKGSNLRPDPARPLIIAADPHWNIDLVGLQEATFAMPNADWLFLGDVFDVWVGINGFETDAQRNFFWWVSERRRTGHWIGLWGGNREYFLDDVADRFDFIGEGTNAKLEGEPFAFEHGDLINTMDFKYRLWNIISRSLPVWVLAKVIPPVIGRGLTRFLERRLRTTNKEYKIKFPKIGFQLAIDRSSAEYFIAGHFHTLEELDNGLSIPWAHEGQFLLWQDGGLKILDLHLNEEEPSN
jgi:UDP-2,3-diacylglucosamine pyrophosphatase LpxH